MSEAEQDRKVKEIREALHGLTAATKSASTPEEWAEISKRFGACQRRARLLAGLPRGG